MPDLLLRNDNSSTEENKAETVEETHPAVNFEDSLTVHTGNLSSDTDEGNLPDSSKMTVSVSAEAGTFPAGTTMVLSAVTDMDAVAEAVEGTVDSKTCGFQAVDISFRDKEGNEIEPLKPISVTMRSDSIKAATKDSSMAPVVVHIENQSNNNTDATNDLVITVMETLPPSVDNNDNSETHGIIDSSESISFKADSFSIYAIVYTVDFEYSVNGKMYQFSLPGGEKIALSDLIEVLGIIGDTNFKNVKAFLKEIDTVTFSDEDLLAVTKVTEETTFADIYAQVFDVFATGGEEPEEDNTRVASPDWVLTSLAPFSSEETLVISMKNGDEITIDVTDDQETNLAEFITDASLEIEGKTYGQGQTWNVREGVDYNTFKGWVESCEAPGHNDATNPNGATNWELALRTANSIQFGDDDPTYILFISDGNPTKRSTLIGEVDEGTGDVPGTYGTGSDDEHGYNLQAANREAQNIDNAKKMLYAIGIFGDAENMKLLEPRNAYYDVTEPGAMEGVFDDLVSIISSQIGYTDVVIEDGLTSLTSSTLVSGTAQNFMYKVTDKDGNDVTEEMLAKLGNPEASYVETPHTIQVDGKDYTYKQKEVVWNLGDEDILLEGGTYSVSFIVWPSQEAYDLAADLNNGLRQFEDLNEIEASQVENQGGIYVVKTNTHESAKGKTAKKINDGPVTPTPNEYKDIPMTKDVDPMPLTDSTVKVQKKWNVSLDPQQLSDFLQQHPDYKVQLKLMKDAVGEENGLVTYINNITIDPVANEMIWPELKDGNEVQHHISAGLMVSAAKGIESGLFEDKVSEDGTEAPDGIPDDDKGYKSVDYEGTIYYNLEKGRDYYFDEAYPENAGPDYHFEFKKVTFHPMVVDGQLRNVTFSGDQVTKVETLTTLTAINNLKGGIRIYKEVYDQDGQKIDDDTTPFTVTVTMKNPNGSAYSATAAEGGWRLNYGPNNPNKGEAVYEGGVLINYGREETRHAITGGTFTATLYPGDFIQVANVDNNVAYEVTETNLPAGYGLIEVNGGTGSVSSNTSHAVVVKNRKTDVGFSFSKVWVAENADLSNIGSGDLKDWSSGNAIEVIVRRIAQGAEEPDSSFCLTYRIDSGAGPFQPADGGLSQADKTKYQLTKSAEGKITSFTMDSVLERADADERAYTYYVEERSASGETLYNAYYGSISDGSVTRTPAAAHAENGQAIINQEYSGYELPSTGGPGTRMFYLLGGILALGAGMLLICRRRMLA